MSSSTAAGKAAGVALACSLVLLTGSRHGPPIEVSARPSVALRLSIESEHYRDEFADPSCLARCRAFRDGLVDSVRTLLQSSYPFLNWDGGATARDTVEIGWVDRPPTGLLQTDLDFRILSPEPRVRLRKMIRSFEKATDFTGHVDDGWRPNSLRRQWMDKLARTFQDPDLLVQVFGRIPINARVTFAPSNFALVAIRPDELRAEADSRPVFLVTAQLLDPLENSDDEAALRVGPCNTASGGNAYSCKVQSLSYISQQNIRGDSLSAILRRATITVKGVRILGYVRL